MPPKSDENTAKIVYKLNSFLVVLQAPGVGVCIHILFIRVKCTPEYSEYSAQYMGPSKKSCQKRDCSCYVREISTNVNYNIISFEF
jgi:hypothetical protein